MGDLELPADGAILKTADLLVLDCTETGSQTVDMLSEVRKHCPGLRVVIIDGGLTQLEIAQLFNAGAQDYFSEPLDVDLMAERLDHLAGSRRI